MKYSISLAIAASFLGLAAAQYEIDPSSVPLSTRQYWCQQQIAECPLICLDTSAASSQTDSNQCSAESLTYSCVCSNGLSPNISEYSQTLPFFVCQAWGNECAANCNTNTACISACRQNHPCGALNPTRSNTTASVTSGSGAATSSPGLVTVPAGVTTTSAAPAPMVTNTQGTIYSGYAGAVSSTGATGSTQTAGAASLIRGFALSFGQTFGGLGLIGAIFGSVAFLL